MQIVVSLAARALPAECVQILRCTTRAGGRVVLVVLPLPLSATCTQQAVESTLQGEEEMSRSCCL